VLKHCRTPSINISTLTETTTGVYKLTRRIEFGLYPELYELNGLKLK